MSDTNRSAEGAVLTSAQTRALAHVQSTAEQHRQQMRKKSEHILAKAGATFVTVDDLLSMVTRHARITLNFHPDRLLPSGVTVVEGLLADGIYQSQFITAVSNGSPTAFPGGDRDCWEEKLFGGSYQSSRVQASERPKYGALNLMDYADGASPRFGSCYIRLRPHTLGRCTFTFGDSHTGPEHVGTIGCFEPVLGALLDSVAHSVEALGTPNMDVPSLIGRLQRLPNAEKEAAPPTLGRALDDYVEAQIHGPIDLSTDVEALVADPSFQYTETGLQLQRLCQRHSIPLLWHPGFHMSATAVTDDFRGPAMPPLAQRVTQQFATSPGRLDAASIGRAAADLHRYPDRWQDWGTQVVTWQHLKQLWHVLVKYGEPFSTFGLVGA